MSIDTVDARKRLKPRRAPYWHKLSTGRHLGYRKMITGSEGTWLAQAYDPESNPKQSRHSLGSFDDLPPNKRFDAATKAASVWFEHINMGGDEKPSTVQAACEEYVKHLRIERSSTAGDTEARFKRWVYSNRISKIQLHKLTEKHVTEWRKSLIEAPVKVDPYAKQPKLRERSSSTVNRDMTAFRAALNYAQRNRAVTSDMAWKYALTPIKNADRRREIYLDIKERRALIKNAPTDLALLLTGLSLVPIRPGALASLVVSNFDARSSTITVGKDKAGKDRKIKLPPSTATFFNEQLKNRKPDAPLFSRADGVAWNKDSWKKPLKIAAELANLIHSVSAMTLRHSVITDLVTSGLDLLTVAQLSGTSVSMIERHYGHHRADHAAAALAKLAL
jgi:integrase